jgi:branched-chain amino acid transport system ATP-binding protein
LALELTVANVDAGYGAVRALQGVSLDVKNGETVVLLGTNGNGKSTLMKCLMGLVRPSKGSITLTIDGTAHALTQLATEEIVGLGVALVPEGRRLFPKLTVEENLMLGAFRPEARRGISSNIATRRFRSWWNGGSNWRAPCRAASSRCSLLRAR